MSATVIHAVINPAAIKKAGFFFDQSDSTILTELLQNARRAGATHVAISDDLGSEENERIVTIEDDGSGISDPQLLLTFGQSGWNDELVTTEDAAGMGIWSLAGRGATIYSRDWKITLTPAAFKADEDVDVIFGPARSGTQIEYRVKGDVGDVARWVKHCAEHFPLPVTLNGKPIEQHDFLDESLVIEDRPDFRIGVRVYDSTRADHGRVNFYGRVLTVRDSKLGLSIPQPIDGKHKHLVAFVDVKRADDLRFVLPARHALVENDAYQKMLTSARAVLLRYAVKAGEVLRFKDVADAHAAGVTVNEPTTLEPWNPSDFDNNCNLLGPNTTQHRIAIADTPLLMQGFDQHDDVNLAVALSDAPAMPRIAEPEHDYQGYAVYDALPTIDELEYYGTRDGVTVTLDHYTKDGIFDSLQIL